MRPQSLAGAKVVSIPQVSTTLSRADILSDWKVRWGIGRISYRIDPGLYRVGTPNSGSPVLVSANYKLTFNALRKNLSGLDCWLLVLDTQGVNVWCSAGKGLFGTAELVRRIKSTGLSGVVTHRRLIVPQLGATGVSAREVARQAGFSVVFGPVRASDIKDFIAAGYKATPEMRTMRFGLKDRLVLTSVELTGTVKFSLIVFGVLFLLNLFVARPFGTRDLVSYLGALLVGTVLTPALLPWIPGKAFAWKGWLLGLCWTVLALWIFGRLSLTLWLPAVGYLLLLPALSAYLAMNFTGCSTYTSLSGVLKEMRIALPLIIGSGVIGALFTLFYHLI